MCVNILIVLLLGYNPKHFADIKKSNYTADD